MQAANARNNDPEATAQFEPFGSQEKTSAKPDMFTDEEWALLSDGPAPKDQPATKHSVKPQASARRESSDAPTQVMPVKATHTTPGTQSTSGTHQSHPSPGFYHKFGFLDFIATAFITLAMPIMLLALAVRIAASGMFLKFEYFINIWFPEDQYGFTSEDRLHFASYVVDYLFNSDSSRYLADIVFQDARPVFTEGEIAHMADVKGLVSLLFFIAIVAAIVSVLCAVYVGRTYGPGLHHALRYSGIFTLVVFVGLAVLALFGWQQFFTGFHQVFFDSGTWEFYLDDSLIRLFPSRFWVDAGAFVAIFVVIVAVLLIVMSRIGHKQRKAARNAAKTPTRA